MKRINKYFQKWNLIFYSSAKGEIWTQAPFNIRLWETFTLQVMHFFYSATYPIHVDA